ncbi:DEBR0S8_01794g1_1 [Brettanomyces bruxellensis]|uniref:DEBR0S8_01794g1_1 n=1 Tax=Dekkera bruxellensis TaxID=5007 RepID=A0A7D9H2T6_DEKBR|nr:DEBR0S8_01794g1_1 [Brettanomyces bruxellensis]
MCGILLHYSATDDFSANKFKLTDGETSKHRNLTLDVNYQIESSGIISPTFANIAPKVYDRGTDFCFYKALKHVEMFSSVLSLRHPLTRQPYTEKNSRFILQFNGELYNEEIQPEENDVQFAHKLLQENDGDVIKTVHYLDGEFAYSITDVEDHKIYFGKDVLGRKSLLYGLSEDNSELYVTSCLPDNASLLKQYTFHECKPAVVYVYDTKLKHLSEIEQQSSSEDNFHVNADWESNTSRTEEHVNHILDSLQNSLEESIRKRIFTVFPVQKAKANYAILFSGGIDCTLLAAFCALLSIKSDLSPKIDLLNVSFSNLRAGTDPSQTPDRKLAVKSWKHLQAKYASVQFNLIEMNITYETYLEHKARITSLMYPKDTVMDLSIAAAFYFASSGYGNIVNPDGSRTSYTSDCKVLLSGLGADELFGGYTRHERVFTGISNQRKRNLKNKPQKDTTHYDVEKDLVPKLRDELQHDLSNLYIRNMARDDRVISCWSKEVRYPYLDMQFVRFSSEKVPLDLKLHYDNASGEITRKYALRLLALKIGLDWVAGEPKRAVQFGARSAKMEMGSSHVKGTDKA